MAPTHKTWAPCRGRKEACAKRRDSNLGTVLSVCLIGVVLLVMSSEVAAVRCYTMSWDTRNIPVCSKLPSIQAGWESACLREGAPSVYCSDFRISEGCPDTPSNQGILPCQFDSTRQDLSNDFFPIGNSLDGNSHCRNQEDFLVCQRAYTGCHKTVTEVWIQASIKYWTVVKGCGKCPFQGQRQIFSACEQTACLGTDDKCQAPCFQASAETMQVDYCYECEGDLCNIGARRAAHHMLAMTFMGIFLSLFLRKCRA